MKPIDHAIVWRRLDTPGHEGCYYGRTHDGWRVGGTAVFASAGVPCHLGYALGIDAQWRTRTAHVFGTLGRDVVDLAFAAGDEAWRINGVSQYGTEDCELLDFAFTPALKLVILRRLQLAVNDEANVAVARLDFPGLQLERSEQRFRRLTPTDFLHACPKLERASVLRVDEHLAIVRYPGRWERDCATDEQEAEAAPHPRTHALA